MEHLICIKFLISLNKKRRRDIAFFYIYLLIMTFQRPVLQYGLYKILTNDIFTLKVYFY